MRFVLLLAVLLSACSQPRLNAAVSVGLGGVNVSPSLSGRVGGMGVSISP